MTETASFVLTDIQKTILRTIAYFASFRYPLTAFEVWKWQKEPERIYSYAEVLNALHDFSWAQGKIEKAGAFYGWVDEKTGSVASQAEERHRRYVHAFQKERKLKRFLWWLARLPFVEGVAVCNTLALHVASERSGVDVFILASPKRVWTARFWTVLPLLLFRMRPGETTKDPIDTNFFVSTDQLSLSSLLLPGGDPYFLYWTVTLSPLFDRSQSFQRLWEENSWVSTSLPASHLAIRASHVRVKPRAPFALLSMFSESFARRIQEGKFPSDTRALLHQDTRVIANDSVLKFHKNDRRAEVRAMYLARLSIV